MNTEQFQAEIRGHAKAARPEPSKAVVGDFLAVRRKATASMRELGLGEHGQKEARRTILNGFYRRWLGRLYPTLDVGFLKGSRSAVAVRDESGTRFERFGYDGETVDDPAFEAVVRLPVYVKTEPNDYRSPLIFRADRIGSFDRSRKGNKSWPAVEIDASTACPDGFGPRHLKLFRRFQADVVEGYGRLIRHGVIDMSRRHRWQDDGGQIPECRLSVVWAPLDENWVATTRAIQIPRADPAVIAECMDAHYLLDFFDTPDEKPITGVIREFTDGPLSN